MKKIYALVSAAFICSNISAQNQIDFESISLTLESYNNGSDGSGDFIFESFNLSNTYDAGWGSWNGFSISNVTDNTTAGWGNQYSAFPGTGRNSSNYGIYYPEGTIQGTSNAIIDSFFITNTTFAGISMRDGDAFGKQFGSIYAADGTTVDGTNGEDFFKVWVIAQDLFGGQKDSLEIYLADYRFANNSEDYIVDEWIKVDVASLGLSAYTISFRFESSDMGAWGINTPTYFAIDDIYSSNVFGIDEISKPMLETYPNPVIDILTVKGDEGTLTIRDVNGNLILNQEHSILSAIDLKDLESGIYFVELVNSKGKSIQKIVK